MGRDFLVLGYSLFPVQACPYSMHLNADLTHDDKWLLNTMLKEVCNTNSISILSFLNMKFHFSTEENQISCSQCIFLTWRHLANEQIKLWKVPEAKILIKGKWIAFSAFWLILQHYNCLDERLFLVSQAISQYTLGQGTVWK